RRGLISCVFRDQIVVFTPHAEVRQVNSGLDRKTSMRDDPPDVARFEAVHVSSRTMTCLPDIVASAMTEVFCDTGLRDRSARGAIHLPAFDRSTGGHPFL